MKTIKVTGKLTISWLEPGFNLVQEFSHYSTYELVGNGNEFVVVLDRRPVEKRGLTIPEVLNYFNERLPKDITHFNKVHGREPRKYSGAVTLQIDDGTPNEYLLNSPEGITEFLLDLQNQIKPRVRNWPAIRA